MGASRDEEWFACENGHPVATGSTICTQCGTQVTTQRVDPPTSKASRSRAATDSRPSDFGSDAPRRMILLSLLAAIMMAAVGGVVLAILVGQSPSAEGPLPGPSPSVEASNASCDGAGVEIGLGIEYKDGPTVSCFAVDEETVVTIGVQGASGQALSLGIERTDGVFWGAATRGVEGVDPEMTLFFLPGAYVISVTDPTGGNAGAFTLYTLVGDPEDRGGFSDPTLPGVEECGSAGAPLITPSAGTVELPSDGTVVHACLRLEEAAFVKVGADAGEGNAADLGLAVHAFDEAGRPVFVRSINDAFGADPEMSLDLEAGIYLVEVEEWAGGTVGPHILYASTDPEFFRVGEVSATHSGLSPADCESGEIPTLRIDGSVIFTDADPLACLSIAETRRLSLKAVSFAGQDLTLEVIGFSDDGTPFRFAWVDDDLWAVDFEILDPRLEATLPAGMYVLAAAEFGGEATNDLMIAVDPTDD